MLDNYNIYNDDYLNVISLIEPKSIDLIVTDPPYNFNPVGKGIYSKKDFDLNLEKLNCTKFEPKQFLNNIKPLMKKFYGYFFCNKTLIYSYLEFAINNKYNYDVLVLNKTNPTHSCIQ